MILVNSAGIVRVRDGNFACKHSLRDYLIKYQYYSVIGALKGTVPVQQSPFGDQLYMIDRAGIKAIQKAHDHSLLSGLTAL